MISIGLTLSSRSLLPFFLLAFTLMANGKGFLRSAMHESHIQWNEKHLLCLTTSRIIPEMCHFAILHAWIKFRLFSIYTHPLCDWQCAQKFNVLPGITIDFPQGFSCCWWRMIQDMTLGGCFYRRFAGAMYAKVRWNQIKRFFTPITALDRIAPGALEIVYF